MICDKITKYLEKVDKDKVQTPNKVFTTMFTKKCERQAAYRYHAFKPKVKSARTLLNFELGNLIEKMILEKAKLAGCEIKFNNEWLTVKKDFIHVICKPDGLYADKSNLYNIEIKKMSEYGYKSFVDKGLDDTWGYISQAQFECQAWKQHGEDVLGTIFIVVNSNTGHFSEQYIKYDDKIVKSMLARVRTVLESKKDKLPERFYRTEIKAGKEYLPIPCSYCDYTEHCWPDFKMMISKGGNPFYVKIS